MALDLGNLESALQARVDALGPDSDEKTLLLLGKALEATFGRVTLWRIGEAEGVALVHLETARADHVDAVTAVGASKLEAIAAAGADRIAAIQAMDALPRTGGTMTGPLSAPSITTPSLNTPSLTAVALEVTSVRTKAIALTDAPTITPDLALGNVFTVTLGGSRVLGNPVNATADPRGGSLVIRQDATGNRALSFGSAWKFPGGQIPALSAGAGKVDRLVYTVVSPTEIHALLLKDMR